jgi:hypothetical protein
MDQTSLFLIYEAYYIAYAPFLDLIVSNDDANIAFFFNPHRIISQKLCEEIQIF